MYLPQISIFLENKHGALLELSQIIKEAKINIRALFLADTKDFGIVRMIVDQPEKAVELLKEKSFPATMNEVIAVEVPDSPGGLAQILAILNQNELNIEYMYGFIEKNRDNALMVMRIEDLKPAAEILSKNSISIMTREELSNI